MAFWPKFSYTKLVSSLWNGIFNGEWAMQFTNWIIIWYNVSPSCPAELLSASLLNFFKNPYGEIFIKKPNDYWLSLL